MIIIPSNYHKILIRRFSFCASWTTIYILGCKCIDGCKSATSMMHVIFICFIKWRHSFVSGLIDVDAFLFTDVNMIHNTPNKDDEPNNSPLYDHLLSSFLSNIHFFSISSLIWCNQCYLVITINIELSHVIWVVC